MMLVGFYSLGGEKRYLLLRGALHERKLISHTPNNLNLYPHTRAPENNSLHNPASTHLLASSVKFVINR
jgi:hypothetical protein